MTMPPSKYMHGRRGGEPVEYGSLSEGDALAELANEIRERALEIYDRMVWGGTGLSFFAPTPLAAEHKQRADLEVALLVVLTDIEDYSMTGPAYAEHSLKNDLAEWRRALGAVMIRVGRQLQAAIQRARQARSGRSERETAAIGESAYELARGAVEEPFKRYIKAHVRRDRRA